MWGEGAQAEMLQNLLTAKVWGAPLRHAAKLKTVPKKQKLLQEDSGIPVHPKHGIMDALVYVMNRKRINFM